MESIKEIFTDLFKALTISTKEFFKVTNYSITGWLVLFPMKILIYVVMFPIVCTGLAIVACFISFLIIAFSVAPKFLNQLAKKIFYK